MRFEELSYLEVIGLMYSTHKEINRELFNGKLKEVYIDTHNISDMVGQDSFASYCKIDPSVAESFNSAILFDYVFFDFLTKQRTIHKQAENIVTIMLHEMIHQYCDENGIDDSGHSDEWQQEAIKHGLHSIYSNDELISECLMDASYPIVYHIKKILMKKKRAK